MIEYILDYLKNNDVEYKEYADLSLISAIRIGGIGRIVAYPRNIKQLIDVLGVLHAFGVSYKVVGAGSNLLFSSDYFHGVIVRTVKISGLINFEDHVEIGCGAVLPGVIRSLARSGLGGAEQLAHIPGSVGGMIYGNAGAYGLEISDIILFADVYDSKSGEILRLNKSDMGFDYRNSIFKSGKFIILGAGFRFMPKDSDLILSEIKCFGDMRSQSQPIGIPSLGSIFKRTGGVSAGKLIDEAGLKGYRIGGAAISEKHAGFIVNLGGASATDTLSLINFVKKRVFDVFGVMLEEEIEIV